MFQLFGNHPYTPTPQVGPRFFFYVFLLLPTLVFGQRQFGHLRPFFFLCNYHGPTQNYGLDSGQVVVSVNIDGNPRGYMPDTFYNISISSSETFDSLLMTGLYTTSSPTAGSRAVTQGSHNVMCSIIHSQVSPRPMRTLSFTWMAPPTGTGCVNFLATATHGQQLLFKDTSIAQLCEEGALSTTSQKPDLAEVNTDSVLIRDDFESGTDFMADIWTSVEGSYVGDDCGTLVSGNSAIFCDSEGSRKLVTAPLNLTSAHVLQFFLGGGGCRPRAGNDQDIIIAYGINSCSEWIPMQRVTAPTTSKPEMHLVTVPVKARRPGTCVMLFQASNLPGGENPFSQVLAPLIEPDLNTTWVATKTKEILTKLTTMTAVDTTTSTIADATESTTDATTTPLIVTESTTTTTATTSTTSPLVTTASTTPPVTTAATTPPLTTATATNAPSPTTTRATTAATQSTTTDAIGNTTNATDATETDLPVTETSDNFSEKTGIFQLPSFTPNDDPFAGQFEVPTSAFHGCWSIDNIVIVNTADSPEVLQEDFDPVDPTDWIFFPGARVDHQCQSHGNAFIFEDRNQTLTYAATRDLDLDIKDVKADAHLFEDFNLAPKSSSLNGGLIGRSCGTVHEDNAAVFNGGKQRMLCTPEFDTSVVQSARFYLKFGGGAGCLASRESPPVYVLLENQENQMLVLDTLEAHTYLAEPVLVTQTFVNATLRSSDYQQARLCLLQKGHGGVGKDVWAVDDFALLPLLPERSRADANKVFQASLNLNCGNSAEGKDSPSVSVEYSTDHGGSWHEFYSPCLPSTCPNSLYTTLSSTVYGKDLFGWERVTLPVPYSGQSPHTRFRVVQHGGSGGQWALDDVFIGSCDGWCSGHGMCTEEGCSCDFGYEGPRCEQPSSPAPSNLQETFEDPLITSSSGALDIRGGSVGYLCGVVASGKAMVFNQAGKRSLTTTDLNTERVSHVQFTMRVGSQSVKSSCPPPDAPWESVLLEASCDGGVTWSLLGQYDAAQYSRPMSVSTPLPEDVQGPVCKLRWRQPQHSGLGKDIWAIDDIGLVSLLPSPSEGNTTDIPLAGGGGGGSLTTLAVEMMDSPVLDSRLTTNLGDMEDSFCGRMRSLKFSSPEENGEPRALKTKAMRVGPGYIAQFDLVMGCGVPYSDKLDNQVYLQYSVDHGISWHLVEEVCLPPAVCGSYSGGSVYHNSKFEDWQTVTKMLPPDTWSQQTKFQLIQPQWSESDVWAVSRMYIGHPCPNLCYGHGVCHLGVCRCNKGFSGESCTPDNEMESSIYADFGHRYDPKQDFTITGGEVVRADEGCGIILSGESLFFEKGGSRELLTKDINTLDADFLQFWAQVGGSGARDKCSGADRRGESVLVRYSNDGGISWTLLTELDHREHRRPTFVHLKLPDDAKSKHTRFQWWQPEHSGKGTDQWALDGVLVGKYKAFDTLEDNFSDHLDPMDSGRWRVITEGATGKYCGRVQPSLVMTNQVSDKMVISQDVELSPGDVLQFEINVDCGKLFRWEHPVLLQYSHDQGRTWSLVEEPCYLEQDCDSKLTEGTIYYTGTHGQWSPVVIPISDKIAMHPTIFRWLQPGGVDHSFSLDNVYIGPPCPNNCHRRGLCAAGICQCLEVQEDGVTVTGKDCKPTGPTPQGMLDRFDNQNMPLMEFWQRVLAGNLGKGCGVVDFGNALYFGGDGTREARTHALNTTQKRILEFSIKIGDSRHSMTCRPPDNRNEGVVLDFSTDNGITWKVLKFIEPNFEDVQPATVLLELPHDAKTERTIFRFWQPLGHGGGMPRAEWAIDSVLVGINDTSRFGFEDKFSGTTPDPHNWFLADAASPRETCGSHDSALEFSRKNGYQIAETWDYHVTPSTFLQFDLALNCGSLTSDLYDVRLEYSVDHGRTWLPVVSECKPPNFECSGYHLSSSYPSAYFGNWTRVTVTLPEGAVSPKTRFRWLRPGRDEPSPVWAIDNVYLGSDCPWLCSGHGICDKSKCLCDPGFVGEFCVADTPLPMTLKDDFNSPNPNRGVWGEIYGAGNSRICGSVVTDRSLVFQKDGLRMAVTHDMDTTMVTHIEFHFRYGCGEDSVMWPRENSVLLQYSTSGGILWKLVREIHFSNTSQPRFYSIPLPPGAHHNATRFRFWQASSGGELGSVWAVDNLFIGPMNTRLTTVLDVFQADDPHSDGASGPGDPLSWTFINNGQVDEFCEMHRGPDQGLELGDNSALVFRRYEEGEISAVTTDLDLGPMSVLQFDINVGCGAAPRAKYPIRLEYSKDGGSSWQLLGPDCIQETTSTHACGSSSVSSNCFESNIPSTVYYAGENDRWRRVVVPLDHIRVFGPLRFRWYQGKIPDNDFGPEWALDNVYIGMACLDHCNGHGYCIAGMMCQCDNGYKGPMCVPDSPLPTYLKDDFDQPGTPKPGSVIDFSLPLSISPSSHKMDEDLWETWSSGHVTSTHYCGKVFTGSSFVQDRQGKRALTTVPLNLAKANNIQFYLVLGCNKSVHKDTPPVYLQYSTNGGIYWKTIEQFEFSPQHQKPRYIAVHLPLGAQTNATQIRWYQPSLDGKHQEDWAVDQIYIGGNKEGEPLLQDDPNIPLNTTWLEHPGARLDTVCDSDQLAWHFTEEEKERYATTADVKVSYGSILQFDLSLGCDEAKAKEQPCFEISLEYSLDKGNNWHLLFPDCLPSMPDCGRLHDSSTFSSDAHTGWNTKTVPIPQAAWSSQTRFRVYQAPGFGPDQTWAVRHLYVGWECPNSCTGRGHCRDAQCVCDAGWSGLDCSQSDEPLPKLLVEDFPFGANLSQWDRVVGSHVDKPCRLVSSGEAMHFTGPCSRLLETRPLDLTSDMFVQFFFLYGCNSPPRRRDEGVLVEFSTDGGTTWDLFTEMHFDLYRVPTFVSLLIPESAKRPGGTKIRWRQPQHDGAGNSDWLIDGVRINGDPVNPTVMALNFTSGLEFVDLITADGITVGEYCGKTPVIIGSTPALEASTLTSREVKVTENHVLHFSVNVGCGKPWDADLSPVNVAFSTDHGMTWTDLVPPCLDQTSCSPFSTVAHAHHHGTHGDWRRVTIPLSGLPVSNGTRFRWQQRPNSMPGGQDWALGDIYIGWACPNHCSGRGQCYMEACLCDEGFGGNACEEYTTGRVKSSLKDTFDDSKDLSKPQWPWVQGGQVQLPPCEPLVSGQALVMNGPGAREVVTSALDLRDARFIQYTASMWSQNPLSNKCLEPVDQKAQSVFLQVSTDGGVTCQTLHTLSPARYSQARRDYIPLPVFARTDNSLVRWVQATQPPGSLTSPRVHWAIDDVFVGGQEINPADYNQDFEEIKPDLKDDFDDDIEEFDLADDPNAWEFSPYGTLDQEGNPCGVSGQGEGSAMVWVDGGAAGGVDDGIEKGRPPVQMFSTNQLIVQAGYMLQFKLVIGCGQHQDMCSAPSTPVRLEYRRDPSSDQWSDVQASCLPGSQGREGLCNPHKHHHPSHYRLSDASAWTRVTIPLNEVTSSSTTQFRWIQDGSNGTVTWALDDIYIGEKCPEMCRGRGDCVQGVCSCDKGYVGPTCSPPLRGLLSRLFDSFEGGVFPSRWAYVRGGGLGFGCGALLPFAHGKTLYFNGCGSREVVTAELDTSHAIKIIFVIQIGCYAQTHNCNIELSEGPDYRGVLLQYSTNKGADWYFIAQHDPTDFLRPRKVAYDIPGPAKQLGTQFRWWQPTHGGQGFDQWAIDHVEIISGRRRYNRRGRRRG